MNSVPLSVYLSISFSYGSLSYVGGKGYNQKLFRCSRGRTATENGKISRKDAKARRLTIVISTEGRNLSGIPLFRSG